MITSYNKLAYSGFGKPVLSTKRTATSNRKLPRHHRHFIPSGTGPAISNVESNDSVPNNQKQQQAVSLEAASDNASQRLQSIQHALQQQQQEQTHPTVSLPVAKALAETAMLAAVSGLAYTLATLLKLESYLGYFLPLPVVIAAMRSGPAAARKTMTTTCFLLLLLLGPLRAITYLFMHGLVAWCLGGLWQLQARWQVTIIVGSVARLLGQLGYLAVTSWTLNENLLRLLLANVYSLLDQIAQGAASPSPLTVKITLMALFAINSALYICIMHIVYIPLLRSMGYEPSRLPAFVQRIIAQRQPQFVS